MIIKIILIAIGIDILYNIFRLTFPKQIYTYPKNGDKITFLSSNVYHKSTAYDDYSGIVEESDKEGFYIRSESGASLVCGIGREKIRKVYWKYTDDLTNKVYVSKFKH